MRATGAERNADRNLPLTRGHTGQQQVGDISARDQQHRPNSSQQHPRREPRLANLAITQRADRDLHFFSERRRNKIQRLLEQWLELRLRLRWRNA